MIADIHLKIIDTQEGYSEKTKRFELRQNGKLITSCDFKGRDAALVEGFLKSLHKVVENFVDGEFLLIEE